MPTISSGTNGDASGQDPSNEPSQNSGPLTQCDLTPEQRKQWEDTVMCTEWMAPGFTHLWYKMISATHNSGGSKFSAVFTKDPRIPIAAADGKNLIINPDTYFRDYKVRERAFINCHEIIHTIYDDVGLIHKCRELGKVPQSDGSFLPFDQELLNIEMDKRINALLVQSKIGNMPADAIFDKKINGEEDILDMYGKAYKKRKKENPNGDQEGDGQGDGKSGFDKLLPPGSSTGDSPQEAMSDRNPQQWAVEVQKAQTLEHAKRQGNLASALKRMFENILEPVVPWVDHIETLIKRATGTGEYDWAQPDEWFIGQDIYLPHSVSSGAGWIVIWGDTSGSMGPQEIAAHIGELKGIMEQVQPKRLTVVWCDAAISHVDELSDPADLEHIIARGVGGGGGTSMLPVLDWINDQMDTPDLFIGFTDGYVSFPSAEPKFPTIWASSVRPGTYPFGQVVYTDTEARAAGGF